MPRRPPLPPPPAPSLPSPAATQPDKPIVFIFTPKHASWLNPIEIWFGVLSKKVLRRGSFRSTTDLEQRVLRFIDYYNQRFAHAYTFKRWRMAA